MTDLSTDLWTEQEDFPLADWAHEVADDNTRLGYLDWVAHQRAIRADEKCVICTGNIMDGFVLIGPFATVHEANEYADAFLREAFVVASLTLPIT